MSNAERMMRLFAGYRGAHGTHGTPTVSRSVKQEIKKTAATIREPVSAALWEQHLRGERALGIIPINEENECFWGCIDIDSYDLDHADIVSKMADVPSVVCRSKSGGAHVFVFLSSPAPAADMRAALQAVAAARGWGGSEIFPKQTQIFQERGDVGNWLNMPYLGGDDTERYAVRDSGLAMSLSEFLDTAEGRRIQDLSSVVPKVGESISDGPPCLQHLTSTKFPDGTRNSGLFALGIYCKKKFGEKWREKLEDMNRSYMNPPLESGEVLGVMQRLEKKDYNYSCKDQPLCSHCDSSLCRTRRYGVGGAGAFPEISGLSKLDTDPPIWFVDIGDDRIELETAQLQDYRLFQKACMEQITVFYMPVRAETWAVTLSSALESAVIIEAPREMSVEGQFMELLESFCRDRHRGERWQDIFDGRPYLDEETGAHWFRLRDLQDLLERRGFRRWGRNKVGTYLREIGGQQGRNIEGKFVRLFFVPDDVFDAPDPDSAPPRPRDPI